jgi:hypothetical protein
MAGWAVEARRSLGFPPSPEPLTGGQANTYPLVAAPWLLPDIHPLPPGSGAVAN